MIQRIQSIYLLVAAILSGAVIFAVPVFQKGEELLMITQYPVFFAMFILSALVSLFSIFRYKNRQQQVVSGRINVIINFVLFGLILYHYFGSMDTEVAKLGFGSFIPIIAVVFITLANRAIMRDETLVRAADRLR
ncbi:MAG: DUF4293 domain-containing protein [Owenweeksia sp.]